MTRSACITTFFFCFFSACSANRQKLMPIGIYDVKTPHQVSAAHSAGFNAILTPASGETFVAVLKNATALGMKTIAYPDALGGADIIKANISIAYIYDEPDVHQLSKTRLCELNKASKNLLPKTPTLAVVGSGAGAEPYVGCTDILGVDWYPVPHRPLNSIFFQVTTAKNFLPPHVSLWAVIQAFDWSALPQPTTKRIGRFPTRFEMRFMTYAALAAGAQGILFYSMNDFLGGSLYDHPQRWQDLSSIVREINSLNLRSDMSVAVRPTVQGPVIADFLGHPKQRVLVINLSPNPAEFPPIFLNGAWAPLFESTDSLPDLIPSGPDGRSLMAPFRVIILEKIVG